MMKSNLESDCTQLTKSIEADENIFEFTQIEPSKGLKLSFNNTFKNTTIDNLPYKLVINIVCDKTLTSPNFYSAKIVKNGDQQTIIIDGKASESCPIYQPNPYIQKIIGFKYLYILLAFVIGLVECFYGFKLFKPTLFMVKKIYKFILVDGFPGRVSRMLLVPVCDLDWKLTESEYEILDYRNIFIISGDNLWFLFAFVDETWSGNLRWNFRIFLRDFPL